MTLEVNPYIADWNGGLGLPEFDKIEDADFEAAFTAGFARHRDEIEAIAANSAAPTFENTIIAQELAGDLLMKASRLFYNLTSSHTNETIREIERKMAPEMARHFSFIAMHAGLFARVDRLYQQRDDLGLDGEAKRLLENKWKEHVRAGAKLPLEQQQELAGISQELARLGTEFRQNVLAEERDFALILETDQDLEGLPDFLCTAMAAAASERGHEGKYAVTLSRSIIEPFLTFSSRRDLRETAFKAWTGRGRNEGARDNRPLIAETVKLRAIKAKLLGFDTYADYKLEDTMAKRPQSVLNLLEMVWEKALEHAIAEEHALKDVMAAAGHNHEVAPWDWRYFAERLRAEKFDFNEAEIKPYLQLDNIIEAAFDTASKLFGLTFKPHPGLTTYHPDARIFEVFDEAGVRKAIFIGDYFNRASKRSGAWMSGFRAQHHIGDGSIPIVLNNMNFAKPPAGEPALLSMEDARTLFHEFGHALHGMLSDVSYPSIAGTSVARDFVELPSQLYEHWLRRPEVLRNYAVHYQTGEPMPQELLDKLLAAETFNAGCDTVQFTASALVDMAYHMLDAEAASDLDAEAFQNDVLARYQLPSSITMRHAAPHFAHVFSGDGYSAGYYAYMWSEVLDADAFRAFEEKGDIFDRQTADRLKRFIYSSGDSIDPEKAYTAFRGQMPSPQAMLEKKGLV